MNKQQKENFIKFVVSQVINDIEYDEVSDLFHEMPVDYDNCCNIWLEFLGKKERAIVRRLKNTQFE